jgi:hypothetical protein
MDTFQRQLSPDDFLRSTGDVSSVAMAKRQKRAREQIIGKVGYEWKNIYRTLVKLDKRNAGLITVKQLMLACEKVGVRLTPDDVNKVVLLFAVEVIAPGSDAVQRGTAIINYMRMSNEIGLHGPSLSSMHGAQTKRALNIEKLRDALITGVADPKSP